MRGQTETHSGCQLLSLRYGTIYDTEGDIIKLLRIGMSVFCVDICFQIPGIVDQNDI